MHKADLGQPLDVVPDVHEPVVQVNAGPSQREQLTATQPDRHPDREQRVQPMTSCAIEELAGLLR